MTRTMADGAEMDVDAVVLAGGFGTRLRAVLPDTQKVMARVDGQPFLELILRRLARAGVPRVILAAGHRAEQVLDHFEGRTIEGMAVVVSVETEPMGTGGAVRHALPLIERRTVLVLNGDSFATVDIRSLAEFHQRRQAMITLAVGEVPDSSRYGSVTVDGDQSVVAFHEKTGQRTPGIINLGVYAIEIGVIEAIPPGRPVSLEREVFPRYCGETMRAFFQQADFIDIGTPESYALADRFFKERGAGN